MQPREPLLFSLQSSRDFGLRVARQLGRELSRHEEREFEWGQHKTRSLESVRGRDVYVIQSLHGDFEQSVNDKLCRLLFFVGALRDAAAARVTAVVPLLCYSRKEQKTKPRDPVMTRYVARLFEAVETDRVVTLDVHNVAAFQNAFRCHTEHLEAHALFADHFARHLRDHELVVVSPDVGGIKRAARFREALERRLSRSLPSAFVEKYRSEDVVSGDAISGDVQGRTVLLIDDMISGGTTMVRAATACRRAGASAVFAAATHGLFTENAEPALAAAPIEKIVVLDHVPPFTLSSDFVASKLEVLEGAGLVAECIRRLNANQSIVELTER